MTILNAILILIGLALAWTILKFVLRLTTRLFACGCFGLVALVGIIWALQQFL
jgi:hypothetical protein